MPEVYMAWAIQWTEYERGWGCRPDGTSFHKTKKSAQEFIRQYWKRQPGGVPDEYTSPGTPHGVIIRSEDLKKRIEKEADVRYWQHEIRADFYESLR